MNNKKTIFQIGGVVIGGAIVSFIVFFALNSGTAKVFQPVTDIKPGEEITQQNVQLAQVSKKGLHIAALTEEKANQESPYGKIAKTTLYAKETILESRLSSAVGEGIVSQMKDPLKNFVINVPLAENTCPPGVRSGDNVAIFSTITNNETQTTGIVDYYSILKVQEDEAGIIKSVVVEATPSTASKLNNAIESGKITVSLVSLKHDNSAQTQGVTNQQMTSVLIQGK